MHKLRYALYLVLVNRWPRENESSNIFLTMSHIIPIAQFVVDFSYFGYGLAPRGPEKSPLHSGINGLREHDAPVDLGPLLRAC